MSNPYEKRLLRVVEYIHANLDGDLSLDALADVAAMSRFHWHRVWTAMTGETLAQTTRRIRLYRASVMLVENRHDMAGIARACGYPDLSSFNRAFRSAFGTTPGAYRKEGRAAALLPPQRGESAMYPVTIRHEPDRRVAAILHKGAYTMISQAFETASATVAARNGFAHSRGIIGIYYEDARSRPEADLRSHAGFVMDDAFQITPPLEEIILAGGDYGILRFTGPYTGLQAAYDYLFGDWLAGSGRALREEPDFELYLNSPMDTAPADLLTEICIPLAQR